MNLRILKIIVLTTFTWTHLAFSLEEPIRNYRSARSLGMGGVLVTTANDGETLFGNSARLADVAQPKLTLFEVFGEGNEQFITYSKDYNDIYNNTGTGILRRANTLGGKNYHLRVQNLTSFVHPNLIGDFAFGIGVLAMTHTNLLVEYTSDFSGQFITDLGPVFSIAHPFFSKTLLLGLSVKTLYRLGFDETISAGTLLSNNKTISTKDFGRQGVGIDVDIGLYYKVPIDFIRPIRFDVGANFRNLVKSHYSELSINQVYTTTNKPPSNDRVIDAGIRLNFADSWILYDTLIALEMQNIGNNTKRMSRMKRVHIGFESRLRKLLGFRCGLHQGYLAGGVMLFVPHVKIQLGTYSEELGSVAGAYEDRRYVGSVSLEI
ncbi:MAG: hypothetical protein AB7F43_11835 [Bacteriovoracia bacterium]